MYCSRTCVTCGKAVKGKIYGVRPKFCCTHCCSNFNGTPSRHYHRRLVSVTRAHQLYALTTEDLKDLNYKTEENPVDASGRSMRLFLGAEVEYIREFKEASLKRDAVVEGIIKDVEERQALEKKKNQIEDMLQIRLGELDATLRHFLIDDYLTMSNGTRTSLQDIKNRYAVLDQVLWILHHSKGAHPGAVFDYCVQHPLSGPAEYHEFQARCERVFFSVGELIYAKLSDKDKAKIHGLSLEKAMNRTRMTEVESRTYWYLNQHTPGSREYLLMYAEGDETARGNRIRIDRGHRVSFEL